MKQNFIIFLLTLFLVPLPVFAGNGTIDSVLSVIVPSVAKVETIPSIKNTSFINPQNGIHNGLEAIFDIKTNSKDTYDFILTSTIETNSGVQNGYFTKGNDVYLMLANKDYLPDLADISDILSENFNTNKNVIAYPVIKNSEVKYRHLNYRGALSLKIENKEKQNIKVVHTIGAVPLIDTYSLKDDSKGIYEATITLNIYRRP